MQSTLEDYLRSKLNEEQHKAATHTESSALILAGAGSGKTRTLTYKIAYLMFEHQIPLGNILAVTFTNKAAAEMRERLETTSQELHTSFSHIKPLRFSRGNNWIGTFHSIFLRILKEDIDKTDFGFTKNFGVYDSDEAYGLIKQILKTNNMDKVVAPKEVRGAISRLKNEGILPEAYKRQASSQQETIIAESYETYQTQLQIANAMDFDDLLLYPYRMFKTHPEILQKRQQKFRYILVDEAQDTNWIQFELMTLLTKHPNYNISLIGDDFQSIYGWRGAMMENFLNVQKIRPDIEIFKLQTNYRSKSHIVQAGSALIKHNTNQYNKDIVAHRSGSEQITIFEHSDDSSEALNLVEFMKKLKEKNNNSRSDFAILYRTNAQSSSFEQVLVQEGIPYKIFGGFKFFDRREVKDILAYVKYIINDRDNISLKRIINVPSRKIGATTIKKLEDIALTQEVCISDVLTDVDTIDTINNPTKKKIKDFKKLIDYLTEQAQEIDPSNILQLIIKQIQYKHYLLKEEGGNQEAADERYANLGQLINLAHKYEQVGIEGLSQFMEEVSLLTDAASSNDEETESIKLMTIHSSKGLEFRSVFIVGAEESIFPLGNSRLDTKLLEEERRLMYVAITRAQDQLFVSYANSRMQWGQTMYNAASRFIEEIPIDLKKSYSLAENRSIASPQFDEGDNIRHKLFGEGNIIEIRGDIAIIKFENTKFGVRKVPLRLVDHL